MYIRLLSATALSLASFSVSAQAGRPSFDRRDYWYLPTSDGATRLYVEEIGPKVLPPIVVLHGGWGAEHSYLEDMLRTLADPRHRFVFYDQRGSLLSPAGPAALSLDKQVADLEQLRVALGIDRLTLLAHSMGTFLAMAYTAAHPDRVAKLILTGAMPAKPPVAAGQSYMDYIAPASRALLDRAAVAQEQQRVTDAVGIGSPRLGTYRWRIRYAAGNIWHLARWREVPGGGAFFNQATADAMEGTMPTSWDFESSLRRSGADIRVIDGDHDYADPGQLYWRRASRALPRLGLTVIADAGHMPWIDDPQTYRRILGRVLSN